MTDKYEFLDWCEEHMQMLEEADCVPNVEVVLDHQERTKWFNLNFEKLVYVNIKSHVPKDEWKNYVTKDFQKHFETLKRCRTNS
jgi:hypothetical protein